MASLPITTPKAFAASSPPSTVCGKAAAAPRLAALVLLAALAGCFGPSADQLLEKARTDLQTEDYASAGIAARNLLKDQPESAAGRYLLGRALYSAGDLAGAEIELERAGRFGHPPAELLPALAELRLAQRRPQDVAQDYKDTKLPDAAATARLRALVAQAYRQLDLPAEAAQAASQAVALAPGLPQAQAVHARVLADRGDTGAAVLLAEALVAQSADAAEGWTLLADLRATEDPAAAAEAYRRALSLRRRMPEAHFGLVRALIAQQDLDGAAQQVQAMRRALPPLPSVSYMEALVTFLQGDLARTAELTDDIIKRSQDDPAVMTLAGMARARLGQGVRAEALLGQAVSLAPRWVQPRVELAGLQVAEHPRRALETLQPLLGEAQEAGADADAWRIAGQAHARLGDFRAADDAFSRAQALQPDAAGLRVQQAKSLIARGEAAAGLRLLQNTAAQRDDITLDMTLVAAHMRRGEQAAALRVLDAAAAKRPDDAMPPYLRGLVLLQQGQRDAARQAFEQSLTKDADLRAAIDALATLDMDAGQLAAARQRYEAYLKRHPKSGLAMTSLAEITLRTGGRAGEVKTWLDRSVQADPLDAGNWLAVLRLQQGLGDRAALLARAQAANAALPEQPSLMLALANAQLSNAETLQAAATLRRLVQLRPQLAPAHLQLAVAHGLAGDLSSARAPMARALELEPDDPTVLRGAIAVALSDPATEQRAAQALAIARTVQRRHPQAALGWQLEAEVHQRLGEQPAAIAAWQRALAQRDAPPQVAVALHQALGAAGRAADARQLEARHLAAQPTDALFLTYLAQAAERDGEPAVAERMYRRALALRQDDPLLMNNLAALLTDKQPAQAVALAERAVSRAPGHPALLDTLARALAQQGSYDRAAQVQTQAMEFAPGQPLFRLNLARIHAAQGQKDKARQALQGLGGAGVPEPVREQAAQLLRELGG